MKFKQFADKVNEQYTLMTKNKATMYSVVASKDTIWDLYIASFPEGTNQIFNERAEYDCNVCKTFIRSIGNMVTIVDGKLVTIWDIEIGGTYQIVADALAAYVRSQPIADLYTTYQAKVGTVTTHQQKGDDVLTWHHFNAHVAKNIVDLTPEKLAFARTSTEIMARGFNEFSTEALQTVAELIAQNSLYKGAEYQTPVTQFIKLREEFNGMTPQQQNIYLWESYKSPVARFKNTVIGTLVEDLSKGTGLESAVKSFETKVAPANYKRPKALITKGMITKATETIAELGIEESLLRRFANITDVSINNVLFADRSAAKAMQGGIAALLESSIKPAKIDLSKVENISIDDFTTNILPNIDSMEIMVENKHTPNLVSLIAPINPDAPNILKWANNFSWSYYGNITDSGMKARVKSAGGKVDGVLRCSIQWNEERKSKSCDLDIHCIEPGGNHIYYSNKSNPSTSGRLDVDIRSPRDKTAVENITWSDQSEMRDGVYRFYINNFKGTNGGGFRAEIEFNGQVFNYNHTDPVHHDVELARVTLKNGVFTVQDSLTSTTSSREEWSLATETFHKVNLLTISPNHWDEQEIGNKHHFFMIDGCLNPDSPRGFYNEFLDSKLDKHRKVFEVLGSKTTCALSSNQISGLGFSSTKRDSVVCKVKGAFTRMLKINF